MNALDPILAEAYSLAHQNRAQAIAFLSKAIADLEMRTAAEKRRQELAQIIAVRTVGDVCGCYVSKFYLDLLDGALAPPS
jgi:hypothetical protein